MNALDKARMAYASQTAPIRTERGSEYDAFARVTRALSQAAGKGRGQFSELADALHRNRQLWTILAANVADPDNALPEGLRARIFYLSEFTDHHTSEVLRNGADPAVLVDINTTVMQGLRSDGGPA